MPYQREAGWSHYRDNRWKELWNAAPRWYRVHHVAHPEKYKLIRTGSAEEARKLFYRIRGLVPEDGRVIAEAHRRRLATRACID